MKKIFCLFLILNSCNKSEALQPNDKLILPEQVITIEIPPICPESMVEVKGNFCLNHEPKCKEWLDPPSTKKIFRRCLTFEPSTCNSKQKPLNFCIDKYEHAENNSNLPMTNVSWTEAKNICESEGKRLCSDEEWTMACEGPELLAHPYSNTRNGKTCYHDKVLSEMLSKQGELLDLREEIDTHPECISSYGVRNMTGNVGEWVTEEAAPPYRSGGKGGWWNSGLRSRCRPTTFGHDEGFKQVQIGFRCCKDY